MTVKKAWPKLWGADSETLTASSQLRFLTIFRLELNKVRPRVKASLGVVELSLQLFESYTPRNNLRPPIQRGLHPPDSSVRKLF